MTSPASAFLLLSACSFFWAASAQGERRQNIWNDPIIFNTKARDKCTMIITGQGEYTKLKLSCQGPRRSYWCEYVGKPYTCRSFNKNPRHYFIQMMWGLRKLNNACQAPRVIKPHMCRKSTDESQMVFSAASFPRQPDRQKEATQGRVQLRPLPTRPQWNRQPVPGPIRERQRTGGPQTPAPTPETHRKRMARLYCWKSMQRVCAYVIGLFRE